MKAIGLLLGLVLSFSSYEANVCEEYGALVVSVYDGDTVTANIEVGFSIHLEEKIRLYRINAPEVRGAEKEQGYVSRDALKKLINGKDVVIINHGRGKYGRIVGEIILDDTLNVSDWMVRNGYAVYKKY